MEGENPLRDLARKLAIGLGLFVAGGVIAFGYSWRPLHGSLTWKIDELEARLDARNLENRSLRDELEQLRTSESERIDPEALAHVESELAEAQRSLAAAEKRLAQSEQKRQEADSGAQRWRKRYEQLRESLAAAPEPAPAPALARAAEPLVARPRGDAVEAPASGSVGAATEAAAAPGLAGGPDAIPETPPAAPASDPTPGASQPATGRGILAGPDAGPLETP